MQETINALQTNPPGRLGVTPFTLSLPPFSCSYLVV